MGGLPLQKEAARRADGFLNLTAVGGAKRPGEVKKKKNQILSFNLNLAKICVDNSSMDK
jgi:hypothetical protein